MCRKMTHLVSFLTAFTLLISICRGQENQITNGEFNAGLEQWQKSYGIGYALDIAQGEGLSGNNSLKINAFNVSAQDSIVVSQGGIILEHSEVYPIGFTAKAETDRQIVVALQKNQNMLWYEWINLTRYAQTFTFEYTHTDESINEGNVILSFFLKHRQFSIINENKNIDVFIDRVYIGEQSPDPNLTYNPQPPDDSIYDDTWANLEWSPGLHASSHKIYFGENYDDVYNGSVDTFYVNQSEEFIVVGFPDFPPGGIVPGTTYYWRVDEINELHPHSPWKGDVWSFTITPYTAYNPVPDDEARFIDPNVTLNWESGFHAKVHYVYFGENFSDVNDGIDKTYKGYVEDITYTPESLESGKTYYWRVDEFDGYTTHKGDVWNFTTKPHDPNLAYDPHPPDGALHHDLWVAFSWLPGLNATSHDIYLGNNFEDVNNGTDETFWGNQVSTFYVIGFTCCFGPCYDLIPGTTHYWRIDEINDLHPDSPWKGDVWSFTITPYTAYNPVPEDEARFIDPNVTLNWESGFRAKVHHVYFGENFSDVNDGIDETYKGQFVDTTYTPGQLQLGKMYYWRIDEFDGYTTHKGNVWYFRTKSSLTITDPNLAYDPWPPDGAIHYDLWAVLSWLPGLRAASHDVYVGKNYDDVFNGTNETYDTFWGNWTSPSLPIGFPDFTGRFLDLMNPGVTIYWRVDEVNDLHPDSPWKGDVWSFWIPSETAYDPNPPDGAEFVDPNVTLSWTAGFGAKLHTVYLVDNFDDVNDATGGFLQETTTYTPDSLKSFQTYYWRVDEFDGYFTHKGDIWRFETGI